jgi:hypothetical protein
MSTYSPTSQQLFIKFSWLPLHLLAGRRRCIICCLAGIWFDEIDRLASKWAIPNRFTGCSLLLCVDGGQLPALSVAPNGLSPAFGDLRIREAYADIEEKAWRSGLGLNIMIFV